jgi:hypothetical protein
MQERPTSLSQLEARIVQLERANRRMGWSCLLLGAVLVASCVRKPPLPAEIVAKEFKVVDDQGKVYASLGFLPWNPEGVLTLYDRNVEGERSSLGPGDLVLSDAGTSIHLEAGRVSMLVMSDERGHTGAKLSAHHDTDKSSLWLKDGRNSIYRGP